MMKLPQRIICKRYLGIEDDFYDEMLRADKLLLGDAVAEQLMEQGRRLLVEYRDLQRSHDICCALQTHTAAFVPDAAHMAVAIMLAGSLPSALERLSAEGVSDSVLVDTFCDLARWASHYRERHGVYGLGELPWVLYPYTGRLFTLGRLTFEMQNFPFDWYGFAVEGEPLPILLKPAEAAGFSGDKLVLAPGLPILSIHIPAGGAMDAQGVDASLAMAKAFFTARSYPTRVGVCESWLMDETLASFLNNDSNIVRFMRRYAKFTLPQMHSTAGGYVFGANYTEEKLQQAPENSSLQRAMKAYLLDGGVLADSGGVLWL